MSNVQCLKMLRLYVDDEDSEENEFAEKCKRGMYIKKPNAKYFEILEVENLDCDIKPVAKSSGVIQKLYEKRRLRHCELMGKMATDLDKVNAEIEKKIRVSSQELKAHLTFFKDGLSKKLKSLDKPEVASYHDSVFLEIRKKRRGMKSNLIGMIQELHEDLQQLENMRSSECKKIFQMSFTEIEKNAYVLPFDLQTIIEHETLKINQVTLNNRRCYEDLKLNLTLIAEQSFKSFMDNLFCLRDKWIRYNMTNTVIEMPLSRKHENVRSPPPQQLRLELVEHVLKFNSSDDDCYSIVEPETWLRNMHNVSNTLETAKIKIIDLHQRVIKAAKEGMKSDVGMLRKILLSFETVEFEERKIQPIHFEVSIIPDLTLKQLEAYWQKVLRAIKVKLESKSDYLINFGELWNRHIQRVCEMKILVLKAVEKAVENSVIPLQELEVKCNLTLDALRQEFNEEKLTSLYSAAVANLDAIRQRMELDYINEVNITEEYYKLMDLEADVFSAEIKEFIYLKLGDEPDQEEISYNGLLSLDENDMKVMDLTKKIEMLLMNFTDMKFWKSELKNALDTLAGKTKKKFAERAEAWVKSRIKEIAMKYQTQMELHHKRYDRIRTQIYQVRQQEIYVHKQVFEEHQAAVEEAYAKLMDTSNKFYESLTEKVKNLKMTVSNILAEAKKENRVAYVRAAETQMIKLKAEFMTEVAVKAEEAQQEIEFRGSSIQNSNLKFMKSIKLFHEDGNYEADEAKNYITALENIDRENINEVKNWVKETKKRESEMLQKAPDLFDRAIRMLMQLEEELRFHENVEIVIHLCKMDFQEFSACLKANFDTLNEYCSLMKLYTNDKNNHLSEDGDKLWLFFITALYINMNNLFYPLQLPVWLEMKVMEAGGNGGENRNFHLSEVSRKRDGQADFQRKDFRRENLEESLLNDKKPKFMDVIINKCCNYMDDLQRLGHMFYRNKGCVLPIRDDLLKPNFEEYDEDISSLFRSFALQCEHLWLQMAHNFLPILGNVKTLLKKYFRRRNREYVENVLRRLNNFETEFANILSKNSYLMLLQLQNLDNKLLSLHGYYRNRSLLSSLENEVVAKTAELEYEWENFMKNYMNKLKFIYKSASAENDDYNGIKEFYDLCQDAVFSEELGNKLISFISNILDRRGFVKKTLVSDSELASDREQDPGRGHDSGICKVPYEDESENSRPQKGAESNVTVKTKSDRAKLLLHYLEGGLDDIDACLMQIRKIIQRETADIPVDEDGAIDINREDWMNRVEAKVGLTTEPEEYKNIAYRQMRKIKKKYQEIKQFLESKTNFHKEVIYEWLDRWKINLAKNLESYTVKYPHI